MSPDRHGITKVNKLCFMTLQADKPELPFSPTGGAEQDWVNMLMASPLFQQINDLQDLLEKNSGATSSDKVQGIL